MSEVESNIRIFGLSPHFLFLLVPEFSPVHASISQSTGAKQMKNASKAFHLLLHAKCLQAGPAH